MNFVVVDIRNKVHFAIFRYFNPFKSYNQFKLKFSKFLQNKKLKK